MFPGDIVIAGPRAGGAAHVHISQGGRELMLKDGRVVACGQPLYSNDRNPVFDQSTRWPDPVVTAKNADISYTKDKAAEGQPWVLTARDKAGKDMWSQPLPGEPVRWGVCVDRAGRVIVALRNGKVLCVGR